MPITHAHSFLVHPGKNQEEQPPISGTAVPKRSALFKMLSDVYAKAPSECDIGIVFLPREDGVQDNEVRNALMAYLGGPTETRGLVLAQRLQSVTTHRSGLALLFLLAGVEGDDHRLLVARFPADHGIIAQEARGRLSVEFIERVFMKSATAYKSALYTGKLVDGSFWDGQAVDRQINGPLEISTYWIGEFLRSQLRTTPAAGTKRLAVALRVAIQSASGDTKQDLLSCARLLRGQNGRMLSPSSVVGSFGLSDAAAVALRSRFARPALYEEAFRFEVDEFDKHLAYRVVELDNGGVLIAEDAKFDNTFRRTDVVGDDGEVEFVTRGTVIDERLRTARL